MPDDDRGRGARDAGHAVVLREPEAVVAPPLRVLREIERTAERQRRVAAFDDRREIEHGQRDHVLPLHGPLQRVDRDKRLELTSVARFEHFFRAAAGLDIDKTDLKRSTDFINDKL